MDNCTNRKANLQPGEDAPLLREFWNIVTPVNATRSDTPSNLDITANSNFGLNLLQKDSGGSPKITCKSNDQKHSNSSRELPLKGKTIVLNPGHGGDDAGAIYGGIEEKNLTFALSREVEDGLRAQGAKVVMTRTTDIDMELAQIDAITRKVKPDAFLSIHYNANNNHNIRGTTAYYWYPESEKYAATMLHNLVGSVKSLKSDGVIHNNFYVIDHTRVPATLMEVAFLSNARDRAISVDLKAQRQIAKAIVAGEIDYLKNQHPEKHGKSVHGGKS